MTEKKGRHGSWKERVRIGIVGKKEGERERKKNEETHEKRKG